MKRFKKKKEMRKLDNNEYTKSIEHYKSIDSLFEAISNETNLIVEENKDLLSDIYSMMYMPQYSITPDGTISGLIPELENHEKFKDVKKDTVLNDILSFVGAKEIYPILLDLIPKNNQQSPGDGNNNNNSPQNQSSGGGQGQNNGNNSKNVQRELIAQVLGDAKKKVEETEKGLKMAGMESNKFSELNISDKVEILERMLDDNDILREVATLAGKMKVSSKKTISRDYMYLPTKISSIKLGDDVSHLAEPSALLDDDLFYAQLADKKLTVYDIKDRWDKERGPLIVMIDTSGSMAGLENIWAKAITMVFYNIAKEERRLFRTILFSFCSDISVFDFEHKDNEMKKLIRMIDSFNGGGTCFETPLRKAIDAIENNPEYHHAGMIFITDGESEDVSENTTEWLAHFVNEGNNMTVITIGNSSGLESVKEQIPATKYINITYEDIKKGKITPEILNVIAGEKHVRRSIFKRNRK